MFLMNSEVFLKPTCPNRELVPCWTEGWAVWPNKPPVAVCPGVVPEPNPKLGFDCPNKDVPVTEVFGAPALVPKRVPVPVPEAPGFAAAPNPRKKILG